MEKCIKMIFAPEIQVRPLQGRDNARQSSCYKHAIPSGLKDNYIQCVKSRDIVLQMILKRNFLLICKILRYKIVYTIDR